MERLSLLCARQSRTAASAWRVPADTPREARPRESGSRWALLAPGPILPSGSFSQRLWCLDLKAGHLMCISLHLKNMIRSVLLLPPILLRGKQAERLTCPDISGRAGTQAPKHLLFPTPWESSLGEDPLPLATVDWASPKHLSPARSAGGWGGQR